MKHALLNSEFGEVRTAVVLGSGRGGTSLIAGSLRVLGICMGANPHPLKHEWSPLVRTTTGLLDSKETLKNIEQMDAAYEIWGWKSPQDLFVLDEVLPMLRKPGLIIVTRDLCEVGLSALSYERIPIEIGLRESASVYHAICNRSRFWPWPILFLPFRDALENRAEFVDLLCSFLEIKPSAAAKEQAAQFVRPGPNTYRHLDPAIPDWACAISPQDLEADAELSGSRITRAYSQEYIDLFESNLAKTKILVERLSRRFSRLKQLGLARQIVERVRSLLSRLPDEDLPAAGIRRFGRNFGRIFQTSSSETVYKHEFGEMLEALASAARARRFAIENSSLAAVDRYQDLARLYRVLQILIRVRSELQCALNMSA